MSRVQILEKLKPERIEDANQCRVRLSDEFVPVAYHAHAPRGVSWCRICERLVVRGMGRWWE